MTTEYAKNSAGAQMRFTEEEIDLIRSTYGGNERLLKLLRKVFLPEYDPNAPIQQVIDLWLATDIRQLTPEQAYQLIMARNLLIGHVEQQLVMLNLFANEKKETTEEAARRIMKDKTD